MTNQFLEHPNQARLECFLLRLSDGEELESLTAHILRCEACTTRLETLQDTLALFEAERLQKNLPRSHSNTRKSWFARPAIKWAGAASAAFGLGLAIMPHPQVGSATSENRNTSQFAEGALSACNTSTASLLSACRGYEITTLPRDRPLELRVDTTDLIPGAARVQVVNSIGKEVWTGTTTVRNEQAKISLPQIARTGIYFLRLYAQCGGDEGLLREFRFEIK